MFPVVTRWLATRTTTMFLWASAVAGFFTGIADVIQYSRYRTGFPETDYAMNLVAGIAAFLMCTFSITSVIRFHQESRRLPQSWIVVSSTMAFVLAFLPRPVIGSAISQDLFIYLGGLGFLASLFLYISALTPNPPDNLP